jgi:ABC-type Na+ efflux pump permease subunit
MRFKMSVNTRHVSLLVRRELTDLRRQRRVFRLLFIQPLVFVALIAAPVFIVQRIAARQESQVIRVAVQGDLDALPGLDAALNQSPIIVSRTTDAARRLAAKAAQVGVVIPHDAAASTAAGRTVRIEVVVFSTQDLSERAGPIVLRRIADYRQQRSRELLRDAGAPADLAAPLVLQIDDVTATSPEGLRFGLGQALPVLLVIQLFGLMTVAEERLAGAKDRRILEPLLLLPFRRSELLFGVGAAAAFIGALSALIVFVPLTLLVSTAVAAIGRSIAGPIEVAAAVAIGAATLALVFTSFGLLLGARASSAGEGSVFVTITQVAVFAVIAASPFLTSVAARGPILLVPVLGPLLLVRDGVGHGLDPVSVLLVVGGALVLARIVGGGALRRLDDEKSVLRSTH